MDNFITHNEESRLGLSNIHHKIGILITPSYYSPRNGLSFGFKRKWCDVNGIKNFNIGINYFLWKHGYPNIKMVAGIMSCLRNDGVVKNRVACGDRNILLKFKFQHSAYFLLRDSRYLRSE